MTVEVTTVGIDRAVLHDGATVRRIDDLAAAPSTTSTGSRYAHSTIPAGSS